eukprot:comp22393_c0_seq1/m.54435 comp22393_c0_seq1/g.54435  ORF comp22393_c0_seq1/g.54435 comp22393_c0_seq1/m.54435 type:complete len:458 (+) comp22393_c0_seq1:691-2064(+)
MLADVCCGQCAQGGKELFFPGPVCRRKHVCDLGEHECCFFLVEMAQQHFGQHLGALDARGIAERRQQLGGHCAQDLGLEERHISAAGHFGPHCRPCLCDILELVLGAERGDREHNVCKCIHIVAWHAAEAREELRGDHARLRLVVHSVPPRVVELECAIDKALELLAHGHDAAERGCRLAVCRAHGDGSVEPGDAKGAQQLEKDGAVWIGWIAAKGKAHRKPRNGALCWEPDALAHEHGHFAEQCRELGVCELADAEIECFSDGGPRGHLQARLVESIGALAGVEREIVERLILERGHVLEQRSGSLCNHGRKSRSGLFADLDEELHADLDAVLDVGLDAFADQQGHHDGCGLGCHFHGKLAHGLACAARGGAHGVLDVVDGAQHRGPQGLQVGLELVPVAALQEIGHARESGLAHAPETGDGAVDELLDDCGQILGDCCLWIGHHFLPHLRHCGLD